MNKNNIFLMLFCIAGLTTFISNASLGKDKKTKYVPADYYAIRWNTQKKNIIMHKINQDGNIEKASCNILSKCKSADLEKNGQNVRLIFALTNQQKKRINLENISPDVMKTLEDEIKKKSQKDSNVPFNPVIGIAKNSLPQDIQTSLLPQEGDSAYFCINNIKDISPAPSRASYLPYLLGAGALCIILAIYAKWSQK